MTKVLVICSSFPPINATAIHRTLALVRRLAKRNYDVLILTMSPGKGLDIDNKLLEKVPENVRILRFSNIEIVERFKKLLLMRSNRESLIGKIDSPKPFSEDSQISRSPDSSLGIVDQIKDWLGQWMQFPDNRIGWCVNSALKGFKQVWSFRPDMIYSSAPMWSCHVLGLLFSRLLGRCWVADCRDPWRANPYRMFRYRSHNWMDASLERAMVKHASAVICNTLGVRRDFCDRYPGLIWKFFTVTNGYDATVIKALSNDNYSRNGICRLVHAGSFYGHRNPEPYLQALAGVVKDRPALRSRLRFKQVGQDHYEGVKLSEIADRYGVADMLELTGPLGHWQALQEIRRGDVAVAASQDGKNCDLQIPRKFYEYFGMQKAMLITGGCCKAIDELPGNWRDSIGIWLVPQTNGNLLASAIIDIYEKWQQGLLINPSLPKVDLTEDRMARQIESIMQMAIEM